MAIQDIQAFSKRLASMLKYYHKSCDEFIEDVWFSACNQQLTDQEFKEGYELVIRKRDFLPPVDDFIKLVKGEAEILDEFETGEVWDRIVDLCSRATSQDKDHTLERRAFLDRIAPVYTYALNKVGGLVGLGVMPSGELIWKKKEFYSYCKTYRQVDELRKEGKARATAAALGGDAAVRALPQATLDAVVFTVDNDREPEREPVEAATRRAEGKPSGLTSIGDALF